MIKAHQGRCVAAVVKATVLLQYVVVAGSGAAEAASAVHAENDGAALTVTGEAVKAEIRLGEPVEIVATVKNISGKAVRFGVSEVFLSPSGWVGPGMGGASWRSDIGLSQEADKGDEVVLEPNEVVRLHGADRFFPCKTLGAVEASYILRTMDIATEKLLPRPSKAKIKLSFEVLPTQFILDVWRGDAGKEKDLQEEMRKLLRRRAGARDHWERDFVECHLEYMAGHALGLLEDAFGEPDGVVRAEAIQAYHYAVWAVGNMNAKLRYFSGKQDAPLWTKYFEVENEKAAEQRLVRLAVKGLADKDERVRVSCVRALTYRKAKAALDAIKPLADDENSDVRSAVLDYLGLFAEEGEVAETIIGLLDDADSKVSARAFRALEQSPKAPPLPLLERAFADSRGKNVIGLLHLLTEQEDANLPLTLLENFNERSQKERLAILAAIAGHSNDKSLELIHLGLINEDLDVQRNTLMRLTAFPASTAVPIVDNYAEKAPANLKMLCEAIRRELQERRIFPFLGGVASGQVCCCEKPFACVNGTVPMVSPDGKWVGYVETGWGRPGGSGGTGRSNLISLVHVVGSDGRDDRVISDMFLVGWMGDSRRIGSVRDGFAVICDLEGKVVSEFGDTWDEGVHKASFEQLRWPDGELRQQFGARMPHTKRLPQVQGYGNGENAAFSPDGKWFGPLEGKSGAIFLSEDGEQTEVAVPEEFTRRIRGAQATWSPDGRYIVLMSDRSLVIDFVERICHVLPETESVGRFESWEYRKCRWNPWSKDGAHLTFVKDKEIWVCDAQGGNVRQLTFDGKGKAMPTFSRDGTRIAYITWQADNRRNYHRLGPTDIWVVDLGTTLAMRLTRPREGRIHCLDWLSDEKILIDRVKPGSLYRSSLSVLDMSKVD